MSALHLSYFNIAIMEVYAQGPTYKTAITKCSQNANDVLNNPGDDRQWIVIKMPALFIKTYNNNKSIYPIYAK